MELQLHTIAELRAMRSADVVLHKDELGNETVRTSQIHHKYLNLYQDEKHELQRMQRGMKILLKKKTEYYLGKADPEVYKEKPFDLKVRPIKSDLNLYLDADPDMQKAQEQVDIQEMKVTFLWETIAQINKRGYEIKAMNEWNKFSNGIV